jgi:hypothetical protein
MGSQTVVSREPFFYVKIVWRFMSGNFMDGQRHGDSTWFRKATDNQRRLNAWSRMARMQRAFIRWALITWTILSIVTAIWAPDLFWLMTGLVAAYWVARLGIWLDFKLFHHYHVQDGEGHYKRFRSKHHRVQKRIDVLPEPVAKLFGGKSEL